MYYASDIYAAGCTFVQLVRLALCGYFLLTAYLQLGGVGIWDTDHGEELAQCTTPTELTQWYNGPTCRPLTLTGLTLTIPHVERISL